MKPVVGQEGSAAESAVIEFLRILWEQGEAREIRIPRHNDYGHTASGYFDDPEKLAHAVQGWGGRSSLYLTFNPVNPALLARAANRIIPKAGSTTSDVDITVRRWLMIDIDPVRPSGISSTDEELAAAGEICDAVTEHVRTRGWPEPVLAMSGNGYYILFCTDLPNDEEAHGLVAEVLEALAEMFDTAEARIDTAVSNAARLVGVIGSRKVKGDVTHDRPHRRSHLVSVPGRLVPVLWEQLEAVASEAPARQRASSRPSGQQEQSLATVLSEHGIEYREQPPDGRGVIWYHVRQCPFHEDGREFECGVGQALPNGAFAGKCCHPEGAGKGWQEWKAALGLRFAGKGRHDGPPLADDGRPQILVTNRHLNEIADDAWQVLVRANDPPWLFQRGGTVGHGRAGRPRPDAHR